MKALPLILCLFLLAAAGGRAADVASAIATTNTSLDTTASTTANAASTSISTNTTANVKSGRAENVAQCFVVRDMYKTQEVRYYVDAVSHCSREYEAVYVMVSFLDHAGNVLGDGLWAIYWCRPGLREVHEFGVPARATGFARVVVRKITADTTEALQ